MTRTSKLPRAAGIVQAMADLVGDGSPGVRFFVMGHPAGVSVGAVAKDMAQAMGLEPIDIRAAKLREGDMAEGELVRRSAERALGQAGDAFVLVSDCAMTDAITLRETFAMLAKQGTGRGGEPRTVLVLMTTRGDGGDIRDIAHAVGCGAVGCASIA